MLRHPRLRKLVREWSVTAVVIMVLLTFRSALADWYDVPTGSMQPTILVGERVVVNKLAYGLKVPFTRIRVASWSDPERGDVVTFPSPVDGRRMIKRVIAVAGDVVAMQGGVLNLNGTAMAYHPAEAPGWPLRPDDTLDHGWYREELPGCEHPVMTTDRRPRLRDWGPVTVPNGHVLLLGDNRDNSADGRVFGFVPAELIEGRAEAVALSLDRDRWWKPRWGRFGTGL
jgi:signal peptidase I